MLADYHNVAGGEPELRREVHEQPGEVRHHAGPRRASSTCRSVHEAGYLNEDFASAKFTDGLTAVATGKAAHYPMITFGVPAI